VNDAVVEKLNELIAVTKAGAIPLEDRWIDVVEVAAMLGFKPRYVLEKVACRPDFPKPMRIDGTGHPRWKASEVNVWAEKQRGKV
jgi:predicted DNA-binding transcriptional regulator AlpA